MANYFYSFLNLFLRRGSFVILTIVLGNLLTPTELGVFLAHMMIIQYGTIFFNLEIHSGVIKFLGDFKGIKDKNLVFSAGLILILFLGIISIIFFTFFSESISIILKLPTLQYYFFFPPLILFFLIANYLSAVLRNELEFKKIFIVLFISNFLLIVLVYILVRRGSGIYGIILALYFSNISLMIGTYYYILKYVKIEFSEKTFPMMKILTKFSLLIYLGTTLMVLDNYIDIFFINYFMDKKYLALYNYAIIFGFVLISIGDSVSAVTYPKMVRSYSENDLNTINKLYSKSIDFTFFIVSTISFFMLINIDNIILFLLPQFYLKVKEILLPLVIGILPFATISSVGTIVTAKGKPQIALLSLVPAVILNIILNILLIPRIGAIGAAIATSSSFLLRAIIGFIINKRLISVNYNFSRIIISFIMFVGLVLSEYYFVESFLVKYMFFTFYLLLGLMLFVYKNRSIFLNMSISS